MVVCKDESYFCYIEKRLIQTPLPDDKGWDWRDYKRVGRGCFEVGNLLVWWLPEYSASIDATATGIGPHADRLAWLSVPA